MSNKYSGLKLKIDDILLIGLSLAYFIINFLDLRGEIVGVGALVAFIIISAYKKITKTAALIYLVLLMDIKACIVLLLMLGFIYFWRLINEGFRLSRIYFTPVFLVIFAITLLPLISGEFSYNVARIGALLSVPVILLYLYDVKFDERSFRLGKVRGQLTILFVVVVLTQMVSKYFNFKDLRLSVFNGTENIALIIIACLFVVSSIRQFNLFLVIITSSLFAIFIFSTESRSAYAIGLPVIGFVVYINFIGSRVAKFILALVILAAIPMVLYLGEGGFIFERISTVSNIEIKDLLNTLSIVDIRGALYQEALDLISKAPFFGYGTVAPSIFDMGVHGIQDFHSSILDILVFVGFFGATVVVAIYVVSLKIFFSRRENLKINAFVIALFLSISLIQPLIFNVQAMLILGISIFAISNLKSLIDNSYL